MRFTPLEKVSIKHRDDRYRILPIRNNFSRSVNEDSLTGLRRLSLKDKLVFGKFLSQRQHSLSAYTFENIFIWKNIYDIFWLEIERSLCIFFKDKIGCFLYLPPLGKNLNAEVLGKCFRIMNRFNKNTNISRIENIEEKDLDCYRNLGYRVIRASCDYICKRKDLVGLRGSCFKQKRSTINSFINRYGFKYQSYQSRDKNECIALYLLWMRERKVKNKDAIYRRLLDDNFSVFKTTLDCYAKLNFVGRTIKIADKIKAVTFGYPLGNKSFVVLFEVCDLRFRGIAQYIFREFCREIKCEDINIMDDSGLDNLKRAKLSYRPYKIVDNFIIYNG